MAQRSTGQEKLLQAVRLHRNPSMEEIIEEASADDLEWFVQMLEFQLEETPHWVKDQDRLNEIQAWTRQVRTIASGALHDKKRKDRGRAWIWEIGKGVVLIIIGLLLGKLV